MATSLNLTSEQQAQIKAIFDEMRPQMNAIWDNPALSEEDKSLQLKALRAITNAKMRALLNVDQKIVFDQLQQK